MQANSVNGKSSSNQLTTKSRSLKSEDFIRMMITQLQNQDPMQPTSNSELMQQMTQVSQLQANTSLQETLKSLAGQTQIGTAGALIGKMVKGLDANSEAVQGVVTSVRVEGDSVFLELDSGRKLALGNVTSIGAVSGQ